MVAGWRQELYLGNGWLRFDEEGMGEGKGKRLVSVRFWCATVGDGRTVAEMEAHMWRKF